MAQSLAALRFELLAVERTLGSTARFDRAAVCAQVRVVNDELARLLQEVWSLSETIYPSMLSHLGLVPALRQMANRFTDGCTVRVLELHHDSVPVVPPALSLALYRLAEVATCDAARLAGARSVEIRLVTRANLLELSIADDGAESFVDEYEVANGEEELQEMRQRIESAHGTVAISSEPPFGRTVRIAVPFAAATDSMAPPRASVPEDLGDR